MKTRYLFPIALLIFGLFFNVENIRAKNITGTHVNNLHELYGVWASKNAEYVRTKSFSILFERKGNNIYSVLKWMGVEHDTLFYQTEAVVRFNSQTKKVFKDVFPKSSVKSIPLKSKHANRIETLEGKDTLILKTSEGKLKLVKVESIDVVPPYSMEKANKDNTGLCLHEWILGTKGFFRPGSKQISLIINTNHNSFTYNIVPQYVYCRAARIKSDNKGTVFAQNIRLMDKPHGEFTSYMCKNDLKLLDTPLHIDDSLFKPNTCVFGRNAIYWSVVGVLPDVIELNGCGQKYFRYRSTPTQNKLYEFFKMGK